MRKILFATLILAGLTAFADDATSTLVARAWPYDPYAKLSELGRGVGIIFTPDLSVPGNCRFYESLGFACFEDADWTRVLEDIRLHNIFHPDNRIRTLILETHGTNGNGLKIQRSYNPNADRSYISVGALQERLEPDGIRYIILSACNSGRLMRPSIYRALDPNPGDKLFLPPTCGIVSASAGFDPSRNRITVVTPGASHIETSLAGRVKELAPVTRKLIADSAKARGLRAPVQFAVSDMLMKMLLRDPTLTLNTSGYVDELSKEIAAQDTSESLYKSFVAYLNGMAARELPSFKIAAAKPKPKARKAGVGQTLLSGPKKVASKSPAG